MSKIKKKFKTLSFSTPIPNLSPCSVLNIFLSNNLCSNIKNINNHSIEYDYQLDSNVIVHTQFSEAYTLNRKYDMSIYADSYIIIIDLESEVSYTNLDSIISYMKENCNIEKKIFFLGIYKNVDNINEDLKEENIKDFIDNKKLNYDYLELNIEYKNDLIKIMEFITNQSISNKDGKENSFDNNEGQSKSKCILY